MKAFTQQLVNGVALIRELKAETCTLKDAKNPQQLEELFLIKVKACEVVFDFSGDNNTYLEEKDIKRKTLIELINFLESPMQARMHVLNERAVHQIINTVAINIFRTPKVQVTYNGKIGEEGFENKSAGGDPDEE